MKGGIHPLLIFSRSYVPIVIRNPKRMPKTTQFLYLALFMLPMVGALGICTTFKSLPTQYKGPELVK
ncbi:hypothetical protein KSF78_0004271 [Schistosoma japonicum]|uniref:Transmembrane protein n=1 Tax=Schistosoma japonicum TaxID=6182 RepID=C1L8Y4_SCHJA|nr:hypothetical protein KSF78_0004271 [Schistosoma japonicum]KAH8869218.1 hypothetical protein KSF78_0004271 [Schistosoma japonicum]CAX71162.1 hypothetical protein [Schistosoma japonicum]CAX76599.1 hypothetical protein [Schistosoma japonicum]CAX76600.1 hypothetical protein [Schistosoma japonicum]